MSPDCRIKLDGAWFADTADDYYAGTPTALADLELTWGRATTVDQPEAASCRVTVADRAGGADLLDALPIGASFEVWAAGDIGSGAPADVVVDGGFEALPLGPAGARVTVTPAYSTVTVTAGAAAAGAHYLAWSNASSGTLGLPPDAFAPDPTAWDAIPRLAAAAIWTWRVAVRAPRGAAVTVNLAAFDGPEVVTFGDAGTPLDVPADHAWHTLGDTRTVPAWATGKWPGARVSIHRLLAWADAPGTWADAPGTWAEYGPPLDADELALEAPPSVIRDVLVFAGRLTDLAVTVEPGALTARAELIAVDQRADLENRYVGAVPWPAESIAARYANILAATALAIDTRLDAPLDAEVVSKRDVDNQPAGGLLTELAAGVDGVLWSATHATLGPYLWLENVALRASLGTLELVGGVVVIVVDTGNRAPGVTELDGCELAADGVTWRRDITDSLTRIDATWLEQTSPQTTEHTVTVDTGDPTTRRLGVQTNLIAAAPAEAVANRILARMIEPQWRCEGLTVDTGRWPPAPGTDTAAVLDLLDGTTRLGRPLVITDIAGWPGGDAAGAYLEGGTYRFDGAWRLGLATSPMGGFGASAPWVSLEPSWSWAEWSPDIAWLDLYGVTGPLPVTTTLSPRIEV